MLVQVRALSMVAVMVWDECPTLKTTIAAATYLYDLSRVCHGANDMLFNLTRYSSIDLFI